jgi:hypothetical protein
VNRAQSVFPRVVRLRLLDGEDRVERLVVLERRHPLRQIPTTEAVAGRQLYDIASSQVDRLSGDGVVKPADRKPVVILSLSLAR